MTDKDYVEHKIFGQLAEYANFYKNLSLHIMSWVTQGTTAAINIDTYVYSSIQGTLESINDTLLKGRINDSYALFRMYYDSTIINVYTNLYVSENISFDNHIIQEINNWVKGVKRLPQYRVMSQYIKSSPKLIPILELLNKDNTYKEIRERCNDHTHYNYYRNLILNDNEVYLTNRLRLLDGFSKDLEDVFIQHLACLFYINEHYMMASNYLDSLEMESIPEEGSQYYVAPFIQDVFDKVLKPKRMDIFNEIKDKNIMALK